MEVLTKFAIYIQNLERKQFKRYVFIFLVGISFFFGVVMYFVYQKQGSLINHIGQLHRLTKKSMGIISDNKKMEKEEQRLKKVLSQNKDFTIKGFFEQFCREQGLTPETGWDARTESVNEKFDEVILKATFKGQTTEKLVQVIEVLDKKEIIYLKEITLRSEGPRQITVDLTIATKKYKLFEE